MHSAFNLQNHHTMACPGWAEFASEVHRAPDLRATLRWAQENNVPVQVLGEGSNVLVAEHVPGLTLLNRLRGVRVITETSDEVVVDVASGVSWHWWVCFSSAQGWHGLENLALIPGTLGAAPVQNIGAYGVEVGEFVVHLDATALATGADQRFLQSDCRFGYRQSVFKGSEAGRWFIRSIRFRLPKRFSPRLGYVPLDALSAPTPRELLNEVVRVRRAKLPDPNVIPNSGSFFTNPLVSSEQVAVLQRNWPELPVFLQDDGRVKLAAGWLIDQAGLRGISDQTTGVGAYEKQALVLVNPQRRSRRDVLTQAEVIQRQVFAMFGVSLEREPQLFG